MADEPRNQFDGAYRLARLREIYAEEDKAREFAEELTRLRNKLKNYSGNLSDSVDGDVWVNAISNIEQSLSDIEQHIETCKAQADSVARGEAA